MIAPSLHDVLGGLEEPVNWRHTRALLEVRDDVAPEARGSWDALIAVTRLRLNPEDGNKPYEPFPEDPAPPLDLAALPTVVRMLSDGVSASLLGRVHDLIWITERSHTDGKAAAAKYLEVTGSLVLGDGDTQAVPYLSRAFQLAYQLGDEELKSACEGGLLETLEQTSSSALMLSLIRLGGDYISDVTSLVAHAADEAERCQGAGRWGLAEQLWQLAADLSRADEGTLGRHALMISLARCLEERADVDEARGLGPRLGVPQLLLRAIEALRRAGGQREEIDRLHHRMTACQADVVEQIPSRSLSFDASELVNEAEGSVRGLPLVQALVALAQMAAPVSAQHLRIQAEETWEKYLFRRFFPAIRVDERGRLQAREVPVASEPENRREAGVRVEMIQRFVHSLSITAQAVIAPARRVILREHAITPLSLAPLVSLNPLVAVGRRDTVARGLYYGLVGQMLEASHILVHQVEASVRLVLEEREAILPHLDWQGVQQEQDLNSMLYHSECEELFGVDLTYALRIVLVEKFGCNLRNRIAHGLLDDPQYFSAEIVYLWALALYFYCQPLVAPVNWIMTDSDEGGSSDE